MTLTTNLSNMGKHQWDRQNRRTKTINKNTSAFGVVRLKQVGSEKQLPHHGEDR